MQKRVLVLLVAAALVISIIIGGCGEVEKVALPVQKYPEKPITVIVPFSVGGGLDMTARSLEKVSLQHLEQPLVIINKPGGAGVIGWNELAGASWDGYTIGIASIDMLLLSLYESTTYNYLTALAPIAQIASLPVVLVAKADQPWQTLDDLIIYARQHPGAIKLGHGGTGSFAHVLGEMFGYDAGIKINHVPFSGGGEMTAALLGGHVQLIFINPVSIKEHVKNGTVRVLAVSSDQRIPDPVFEQIPTFKEQGFDITLKNWHGIAAPKEIPVAVKNKLAERFKVIIADPEFKKNMDNIGMPVEYLGPEESQAKWITESQKLKKTLEQSGILEQIKAQKK
ncbi:Tripartite tricarboxylate transporter family receptor [Sporomusa termitida]|uniref:Tripartite tricarboxylate transporter family receptor n=1 Tax=Sporomusa termitida TaxID=2377 RepID=A0A517DV28_9FIRM|nr:Tripartite tricarboxylate transporter family receptor [Sporomusa termitida]